MSKCIELLPCDWMVINLCYQAIEQVYLIKWPVSVYNIDISDHPDLDQPILYLQNAFTVKFALCISPASISGKYKCQETQYLAAYQYP